MQILLHADPHTDGSQRMSEHLNTVVQDTMARFTDHITRVEAHLSNVHSQAQHGSDNIHCTLEARLVGLDAIVVKDHASNTHQAIDGAVRKLQRAVGTELAKQETRNHRPRSEVPIDDDGAEKPG